MAQHDAATIRNPRTDDRPLWDVVLGLYGYPAVLLAHRLKLFPLLAEQPRTLPEVCAALQLAQRPAAALLSVCASLGFVELKNGEYSLTPVAEGYLLESSPTYFGGVFDFTIANAAVWSLESLEKAVRTDTPQIYGSGELFKSHEEQAELARTFTRAMHSVSMAPASAWPEVLDLSRHRLMLDIGGGSGAHCIGATLRWPHLHALVFDMAPVCEVAQEFIALQGLQTRVRTHVGDLWNDSFPPADLHFYSMIYHDWPPHKCRFLARKSFEGLQPGGRLIIHEQLYNDDRTGPFPVAAQNIIMLAQCEGQQYSGRELSAMLAEAGFIDIEVKPTWGYWSIVTGRKP